MKLCCNLAFLIHLEFVSTKLAKLEYSLIQFKLWAQFGFFFVAYKLKMPLEKRVRLESLKHALNNALYFLVGLSHEFLKAWNGCLEFGIGIDVALVIDLKERLEIWMKMNEVDECLALNSKQFSWMNFFSNISNLRHKHIDPMIIIVQTQTIWSTNDKLSMNLQTQTLVSMSYLNIMINI